MSNFDFLSCDKRFDTFSGAAEAAENAFATDSASCVIMCRHALELAVKWLYSADSSLKKPYEETLSALVYADGFRNLVKEDLFSRISYIRRLAAHAERNPRGITKAQAHIALHSLFQIMDFIASCYGENYQKRTFDKKISENNHAKKVPFVTEAETRKAYIDVMLMDGGWVKGRDWREEVYIENMPNASGEGYADYVLYGDDGRPLAVVEAKKTSVDPAKGRQQAKLYADDLERRYGRRPVIFLTNGYDTRIWADQPGGYPERRIYGIYGKRDMEKLFGLMGQKHQLEHILVDDSITGRYYQKEAVKAVCETFGRHNRRKALLVMATGSGKTRTVISIVKTLMNRGWIRNFLFLADRTALVRQAMRSFVNLLPDVPVANLCEAKSNTQARGIFSTYPAIMNRIDDARDGDGNRIFTCGHFDLIITDEAHRSIYKKYKSIFDYFDGLLIGLTATPKNEIDRNTYEIFGLEDGVPTYAYELAQAVHDKFLVDYKTFETKLKFIDEGISYDELSEAEKQEYEEKFADDDGNIPEKIGGSALNDWVFNRNTIVRVLNDLMTRGLSVEYGTKTGKSIIFAKNHLHAEKIYEIFNEEYPSYPPGFCRVIDNYTNYSQSLIDDFSDVRKMPQIAVSVDMLDTGIDVPEILNLVFFKKVMSKAKFWQMIGRGTRLCPGLLDGKDKTGFYIFDYCSNFEFFGTERKDVSGQVATLQEQLFRLKLELALRLQDISLQNDFCVNFRKILVSDLHKGIMRLNRNSFAVRQHLCVLDRFSDIKAFENIAETDVYELNAEIAPLVLPEQDDSEALRFDALLLAIEIARIMSSPCSRALNDLKKRVSGLSSCGNIPEVQAHRELIEKIIHTDYINHAGLPEFEEIRQKLRGIMRFVPPVRKNLYDTDFTDKITDFIVREADLATTDLENYRKKAEHFLREHRDWTSINRLISGEQLSRADIDELEHILWHELGSKEDYENATGNMPLGEFVRSVLGMDISAVKAAFSRFIDENSLDSSQIQFVNRIIDYIAQNGMMPELSILAYSPFDDWGSVAELFPDSTVWEKVSSAINYINTTARW